MITGFLRSSTAPIGLLIEVYNTPGARGGWLLVVNSQGPFLQFRIGYSGQEEDQFNRSEGKVNLFDGAGQSSIEA